MLRGMPNQRTALVTGGAKRVGRAIVERLSSAGFSVAFTCNSSRDEAEALAGSIGGIAIQADLTDPPTAVKTIAESLPDSFDHLDVLVNNASLYVPARLADTDVELARRLMSIHFESPCMLCRQFAPMLRAARGHVINMVDVMVEKPMPQYLAYSASKAALWNLTLSLARELAPEVTVNGIAPGVVEWPADFPAEEREKYLKRVPLARAGTPTDVAETVYFLATTGSYITGQIIRLDGGRSLS
jgi:pteridine reductase